MMCKARVETSLHTARVALTGVGGVAEVEGQVGVLGDAVVREGSIVSQVLPAVRQPKREPRRPLHPPTPPHRRPRARAQAHTGTGTRWAGGRAGRRTHVFTRRLSEGSQSGVYLQTRKLTQVGQGASLAWDWGVRE